MNVTAIDTRNKSELTELGRAAPNTCKLSAQDFHANSSRSRQVVLGSL